jgi:hypothetical protein
MAISSAQNIQTASAQIPSRLVGGTGIRVDGRNLTYVVNLDIAELTPGAGANPAKSWVPVWYENESGVNVWRLPINLLATDAPSTGVIYGRQDGEWVPVASQVALQTSYPTTVGVIGATVDQSITALHTLGYATPGDGGGALFKEITNSGGLGPGEIQSNSGTRRWRIASIEITPQMLGAKGDGTTDDTAAFNGCWAATLASSVQIPKGVYSLKSPINTAVSGKTFKGVRGQSRIDAGALTYLIDINGGGPVTGQSNMLAVNGNAGDISITLATGKGINFSAGGWVQVVSEATIPQADAGQKEGEFVYVESVTGDVLNLAGPLRRSYLTSSTAQVFNLNLLADVVFEDLVFESPDVVNFARIFCRLQWCLRPRFINCHFTRGKSAAMYFHGCIDAQVIDCTGVDLLSDPQTPGAFGYFICEAGPNRGMQVIAPKVIRVRHGYTTVASGIAGEWTGRLHHQHRLR